MARTRKHEQQTGSQKAGTRWPTNGPGHDSNFQDLDEKTAPVMAAAVLEAPAESSVDTALAYDPPPVPFFDSPGPDHESLVDIPDGAGFDFNWGIAREPVRDERWAATLRRYGRATAWLLPAGVVALTLAMLWGWPTPSEEPSGASPGTWLAVTAVGFGLWLIGLTAVAALLATTPGRIWSAVAVVGAMAGTALLLPVVGVIGLARPAVSRTTGLIGADAAQGLQAQLLDGTVSRWLAIGGAALLGVGALALAGAILASDVLNRLDGWFVLIAVGVATAGAYLSWEFLLTVAGMVLLAASLGIAWNASRLTADGRISDTD
jgi:hypothetical protein